MAQITWQNVSEGQTFGDAGETFKSAFNAIDESIAQAGKAFDTFRQGEIQAKDSRTNNLLSDIRSAQTPDSLAALKTALGAPGALDSNEVDVNKIKDSLLSQEKAVRDKTVADFEFTQVVNKQQDSPKLKQLENQLRGLSADELGKFDIQGKVKGLGLNDESAAFSMFDSIRNIRFETDTVIRNNRNAVEAQRKNDLVRQLFSDPNLNPLEESKRTISTFDRRNTKIKDIENQLNSSKLFTPAEVSIIVNANKQALGLDNRSLFRLLVNDRSLRTPVGNKVDLAKLKQTAINRGLKIPEIEQFVKEYEDASGETLRKALAAEQVKADRDIANAVKKQTLLDEAKDKQIKEFTKSRTDYINSIFNVDSFLGRGANEDAIQFMNNAISNGANLRAIDEAIRGGAEPDWFGTDFNIKTAERLLKEKDSEYKKRAKVEEARNSLQAIFDRTTQ